MSSTISLLTPTALKAFNLAVPSTTTAKVLKSAASSDSGLSDGEDAASSVASNASKVSEAIDAASTLPSEVVPQVLRLIETFPTPTAFGVCTDEHTGCMKPCCIAATAYMEGAVAASAARLGTPGVLDVLQAKFAWGPARCWTLCSAMKQTKSDCGSMMNLALTALRLAPAVVDQSTRLVRVQYVRRWHAFQAAESKGRYSDVVDAAEKDFVSSWISTDCYYHQCVGLVKADGSIRIWDWGKWHMPPTDYAADRAIIAVKFTIDAAAANDGSSSAAELDWHGLQIPTGEWVTLLPNDVAAAAAAAAATSTSASTSVKNVEPLRAAMTDAGKRAILQSVFAEHSLAVAPSMVNNARPAAAPTMAVAELAPTVYIGGNHMSHNPCPGVGVSRALRLRFPEATTIAVDNASDPLSGMVDSTFSRTVGVDVVMNLGNNMSNASKALQWDLIESMLNKDSSAFYLPCSDALIDSVSESLEQQDEHVQAELGPRILAPPVSAVEATEKPAIAGAKATGLFEVPPFMTLDADTRSATDIEEWCKVHGYPVLVKGPVQGATLCSKWCEVHAAISSSWGTGGYVQKCATGFQMGLAYAAYKGELTAAVLMEKTAYVGSKAWGGNLRPVPPAMLEGLKTFCKEHNWTGGGELEYIEDVEGTLHAIDWNPRFPAWIFGGCYAGVNLPAALVQHALHRQSGGAIPFPSDVLEASAAAYGGFTRTCVEIPSFNTQTHALAGFPGFINSGITSGKSGATIAKTPAKMNMLPKDIKLGLQPEQKGEQEHEEQEERKQEKQEEVEAEAKVWLQGSAEPDMAARETLTAELNALIPADTANLQTPAFILSRSTVRLQLDGHKAAVQKALDATGEGAPELKMCLSVKTQPHPVVLAEARDAGYLGEVITSAEMHACLDAGWMPNEIVMNGPGKWYGDMSGPRSMDVKPTTALRCLFADSIADLETIVARITDPQDWLDAEIIGCRFSPVAVTTSRFGMNCKDPQVLLKAAALLNQLPARVKVGVHMHFASSTLGLQQWFGVAQGYLRVAVNFERLLDCKLAVMDFGGGWPSHLLDHEETHSYLVKLFTETRAAFPTLEAVQFEPGKSITERAGAVLTKVIEIREMERSMPDGAPTAEGEGSAGCSEVDDEEDDLDAHGDKKVDKKGSQNRAAVVDACISDMGSMPLHVHPLVWQAGEGQGNWSSVEQGKDQLWGSICMEFDVLGAAFKLPETAAVGDHVLIAFTGAYDTTMAYDFADGKARDMLVV